MKNLNNENKSEFEIVKKIWRVSKARKKRNESYLIILDWYRDRKDGFWEYKADSCRKEDI